MFDRPAAYRARRALRADLVRQRQFISRRSWDSHEDIERDHGPLARGMAHAPPTCPRPQTTRLLEDTIIHWTTEFGRMPSTQGSKGRDHNPYVFTNWLCGGGIRGGVTADQSDEWGYKR